jgi:hypothetical protein
VFWQVEGQTGLYVLFKTVCDSYDLLPAENYKLPPEAEGLEPMDEPKAHIPSIMKSDENNNLSAVEEDFISVSRANTNTRRHIRQSPSVGSAVHTVLESDEEDPDITHKLDELNLADEEGAADVPVIVESYEADDQHDTPEDKPEPVEEVEHQPAEHDNTTASTGSWDRMSSESLEEKPSTKDDEKVEASEKTEEAKSEEVSESEPAKSPKKEKTESATTTEEVPETAKDLEFKEEPQEEALEVKQAEEAEAKKFEE